MNPTPSKIIACYAVWNEGVQIAESIRSVKAYVDGFVFVDSVYLDNPTDAVGSTDDTRAIVEALCPPLPFKYLTTTSKALENHSRNRYLDELTPGDWALVIDGDEVLYGQHNKVLELFDAIRDGVFDPEANPESLGLIRAKGHDAAVGISIFGQTVMVAGPIEAMTPKLYATAPIICHRGWMARLFRVDPGIRYPDGPSNQGLFRDGRHVGPPLVLNDQVFLVNHRPRQSYEGHLLDYEWLSRVREPRPANEGPKLP